MLRLSEPLRGRLCGRRVLRRRRETSLSSVNEYQFPWGRGGAKHRHRDQTRRPNASWLGALPRPRRAAGPDSPGAGRGRRAAPWLSVEEGLGSGGVGQHHNLWTASSRMVTFFSLRNVAVRGGGGGSGTSPTKLAQPLGRRSPPAPGPVGASRGSEAARSVPSEGE